jgi:nucleoside diphosphate kinase
MNKPESDPRVRALARETSQKIQALTNAHNAEIKAIYQDFRTKADTLVRESDSADELDNPSAGSLPTDQ